MFRTAANCGELMLAESGRGVEPITCSLSTKPGQYLKEDLSNEALVKLWLGEITVL